MNTKIQNEAIQKLKEKKSEKLKEKTDALEFLMKNDEYATLEMQRRSLIFEIAKNEIFEKDNKELKNKLKNVENNQINIKNKLNIRLDVNSTDVVCKKCNDDYFVNGVMCDCLKKEISKLLLKASGAKKSLQTFSSCNFDIFEDSIKTKIKNLYDAMQKWCSTFESSNITNVAFFGASGVGKTFLTECMASELISNGHLAFFTTAFALNNDMLKYHTTFDNSKNEILKDYLDCDVLFIDDLGTEPIFKNVTLEYFYLIVNERTSQNKPIVISTNMTLDDFRDRYGDRIFSRLLNKANSKTFLFPGSNKRLK